MSYLIKTDGKVAIEKETVEGVYEGNPQDTSFVKAIAESGTINQSKEELTEKLLGDGIGMSAPKHGLETGSGSFGFPLATSTTEGGKSPLALSLESLLGEETIMASGNCTDATASVLTIPGHSFRKDDIIIVKAAGMFEARPVLSVAGDDVNLAWPLSAVPSSTVAYAAVRQYRPTETGHPSLSISQFYGEDANAVCKQLHGAKCISMSFDNFVTGQLADVSFGYEALAMKKVNLQPVTPIYSQAERSAILGGCVFQNGQIFSINELSLAVQNTLAAISDTKNGKKSLKVISREVTGSINPYQATGAAGLTQHNLFDTNQPFSLFIHHSSPTATEGENANWVCVWMPNCHIQSNEEGDFNSIITENISFKAVVKGSRKEIFIAIS